MCSTTDRDPARTASRRRRRWLRRAAALSALLAPGLWIFSSDLGRRASFIAQFSSRYLLGYAASVCGSTLLWALLLSTAAGRRGSLRKLAALVFVTFFTLASGVQGAFYTLYRVYLSLNAQLFVESLPEALVGALPFARPLVLVHLSVTLAFSFGCLLAARRFVRPTPRARRVTSVLSLAALVAVFSVPVSYSSIQSTSPDLIYFHGISGMAAAKVKARITKHPLLVRVGRRSPLSVPNLVRAPSRPRNVLFFLQESQRADVTCIEYDPQCPLSTRASNALVPGRFPFLQMRSNASSTAIAISNIWSGLAPTESRKALLSAPLLWEYAHAAGYDTAYWTSQDLMFQNARLYVQDLPVSHFVSGTELDPLCDVLAGARDELLADRAIDELGELKEPFFAVIHLSNIHQPRIVDAAHLLFSPTHQQYDYRMTATLEGKNFYKNSVYLSDLAVAKVIRHLQNMDRGKRTVIVYTSDHAESYREHRNHNDHSGSVYDEEIHVPFWIDAPSGTLSPEEEESLRKAKNDYLWQFDIGITILDLLGVWDDPKIAPFRAKMLGHPVTRKERTTEPVPMTNTSWVWEYVSPNWGMMQGPLKVLALPSDKQFRCYNVEKDPGERYSLGEAGCPALAKAAHEHFGFLPGEFGRLPDHPEFAFHR